jgi:hypothetical protein
MAIQDLKLRKRLVVMVQVFNRYYLSSVVEQ